VQNAKMTLDLVRAMRPYLKPGDQGALATQFLDQGDALGKSLHAYGHKDSMVNPDWQAAGLWTRQATEQARRMGLR
jgi:hypothetical protein